MEPWTTELDLNMNTAQAFVAPAAAQTDVLPKKRGRPAKHADAAARQKAWREANSVKTLRLDGKIAPTIASLAEQFDCTETEAVNHLLRFALANRNWRTMGMTGWAMTDRRHTSGKRALPVSTVDTDLDSFSLA
jgi:hypothetical protein